MNSHNKAISIGKGICILLMVIGHSACPKALKDWLYMFHMPFFFFVSGYLFNEKALCSFVPFLKKKIKSLWWPFFKWNIIFILLHNLLFLAGFESTEYTWPETLKRILLSGLMAQSEDMLGTFWFLQQLIRVVIIGWIILKLHQTVCKKRSIDMSTPFLVSTLLLTVCLTILSYSINLRITGIIYKLTFLCLTFFLAGYLYKLYSPKMGQLKLNKYLWLIGAALTIAGSIYMPVKMHTVDTWQIFPYWIIALSGCVMVMQISSFIQDLKISVPLDYIGKHTLNIMVWHFLSFKLLTLLLVTIGVMAHADLLAFPVPHSAQHGWWILYSVVGAAVPLTIEQITNCLYRGNHNKHHPT